MKDIIKYKMKDFIKNNKIAIVYFSGSECFACGVIKDKLKKVISEYEYVEIMEINAIVERELSAQLNVFTLPLAILYIEGKEVSRYGRNINIIEVKKLIDRFYNLIYK